jgi:hypothetical protein
MSYMAVSWPAAQQKQKLLEELLKDYGMNIGISETEPGVWVPRENENGAGKGKGPRSASVNAPPVVYPNVSDTLGRSPPQPFGMSQAGFYGDPMLQPQQPYIPQHLRQDYTLQQSQPPVQQQQQAQQPQQQSSYAMLLQQGQAMQEVHPHQARLSLLSHRMSQSQQSIQTPQQNLLYSPPLGSAPFPTMANLSQHLSQSSLHQPYSHQSTNQSRTSTSTNPSASQDQVYLQGTGQLSSRGLNQPQARLDAQDTQPGDDVYGLQFGNFSFGLLPPEHQLEAEWDPSNFVFDDPNLDAETQAMFDSLIQPHMDVGLPYRD